jgi:hypothetical protein
MEIPLKATHPVNLMKRERHAFFVRCKRYCEPGTNFMGRSKAMYRIVDNEEDDNSQCS